MIVATTGGNSNATLSWIPVPGATNYTIRYGLQPGVYTESVSVGNVTSFGFGGLNRQRYYFTVLADNGSQTGGNAAEVPIETNLAPTAAEVYISGRITSPAGYGLAQARVTIDGGNLPQSLTAITNPFGYYSFHDIAAGQSYVITVSAKRYTFRQSPRLLNILDDMDNVDFTSSGLDPSLSQALQDVEP